MSAGYRGLPGAFPFAYRSSTSRLFRLYVVVAGLLSAFITVLFTAGVLVRLGKMAGVGGGSLTLSIAFYILVWLLSVAPIIAPVLLVARRHRLDDQEDRFEPFVAMTGFLYVSGLYVAVVLLATFETNPIRFVAPVPPVAAVALMWAVHRRYANGSRG
jgi:hypothetical protein